MVVLLLALLKFAVFLLLAGLLALLIGAVVNAAPGGMRRLRARHGPLPEPVLDSSVADALEVRRDLDRGQAETGRILHSHHDSGGHDGSEGGGDGGGSGGD